MISIVTATYNRKDKLYRLFESLLNQSNKDFEWIVIDDGSIDGTENLINNIMKKSIPFKIKLYVQNNSGKHVAINNALKIAKGELFFIVDSDDFLPINAIDIIYKNHEKYKKASTIIGYSYLKADKYNSIIGKTFKNNRFIDITNLDRKKNNIYGDRAEIFFTKELRKYEFPSFKDEKFISEAILWNKIAHEGKKLRFINEIVYNCEYQADGISNNIVNNFLKNWKGYTLYVDGEIKYRKSILSKLSIIYSYLLLAKEKQLTKLQIKKSLTNAPNYLLNFALLTFPLYKIIFRK